MKILMVLIAVLAGVWFWRNGRRSAMAAKPAARPGLGKPQDIVACPVCALHVARNDALPGKRGLYCCAEHLRQAEP